MSKNKKIILYDTTLRDGTQAEEINFTAMDKVLICKKLDEFGFDYIEGGWPGSNPKDITFFNLIKKEKLTHAKVTAFGSTRRKGVKVAQDENIKALLKADTPAITVFGKSWKLHVKSAIRASLSENLDMIGESVSYLKKKTDEVFYDAEHFFDGYNDDPEYALKTLEAAHSAGADYIVLCDTNGGILPFEIERIVKDVALRMPDLRLGIHCHNDTENAVANSVTAIMNGATMVQGTINGIGERCGNANLCSIIPTLELKLGYKTVGKAKLKKIKDLSHFVYELANLAHRKHQPYVGESSFAHKGGVHVSAVLRHPETYEHIRPELVGNRQRVLVSDLSGKSNLLFKAREYGVDLEGAGDEVAKKLLKDLKDLEGRGYQYEGADGSFELLMLKALKKKKKYFNLKGFRVINEKRNDGNHPLSEATIELEVDGKSTHTVASGDGPVNALDKALRLSLENIYPELKAVKLLDYKVRVLAGSEGTASLVRVLVESGDGVGRWGTVGVSEDIVEASFEALKDSLEYKLYMDAKLKGKKK